MGHFSLVTFDEARSFARSIAVAARERRMPPWLPRRGDYPFADDRRLSQSEIGILERWSALGAPEGQAATPPPLPAHANGWMLGEPDLVLELEQPYILAAGAGDVFRNFVLSPSLSDARHVRAVELQPGDPKVVHHVILAIDPTSASRQDDAADSLSGFDGMFSRRAARPPAGFFVGWTPGRTPRPDPSGLAWTLEPGSDIVVQMHLRPQAADSRVQPRIALYFTDTPPARSPVLLRLGSQTIDIPAGVSDYEVIDSLRLPIDVQLLSLYPHAHYLCKVMDVHAVLPDGTVRTIIGIDDWDFNWQDAYSFVRPVALPAGTVLRMRYLYDNSAGNVRNPNHPPRRVIYGPHSDDEMAELWIQALARSPSDAAVLEQVLTRKGIHDRVEGWLHLIRVDPEDAVSHANLGAYYSSIADTDRALEHYRSAVRIQPDFAAAQYNLGLLHETRGEPDSAVSRYRAALERRPDHAGTHNNLGNVLLLLGDRSRAERHFRRAIELEPAQAEAHNNLGRLLWEDGRAEDAIEHYRAAIVARADAAAPRYNLGLALASLGRMQEAQQAFREGEALDPRAIEAYVAMAWLLATHPDPTIRRPNQAVAIASQAARLFGAPQPRILDVVGAAEAAAGRFERAVRFAREALDLAERSGQSDLAARIRERLELYRRGQPYIETRLRRDGSARSK